VVRYERRRPEQTPLHRFICRHLESRLADRSLGERPVPTHVEAESREYFGAASSADAASPSSSTRRLSGRSCAISASRSIRRTSGGPTPDQRPPVTGESLAEVPLTVLSFFARTTKDVPHVRKIRTFGFAGNSGGHARNVGPGG